MKETFSAEDVAVLIRARRIIKDKGLPKDIDVSGICDAAGVSRKTGYEWADKLLLKSNDQAASALKHELEDIKKSHAELQALYKEVRFENEGRKVAWKIHGIDAYLAGKKNTSRSQKKPVR
jgi:hypothetical protein